MDSMDCNRRHRDDRAALDSCFMAEALALARSAKSRTWPNPPVGAVVVKDGVIVGRGAHEGPGKLHAEPVALNEAGEAARGATLYVTLEPCNHEGRTLPCAPAVASSGVTRVVVAIRDPNPTVIGGGCRYLRDRGLEVICGVLAEEALDLVWPFAATDNFTHGYVELKTAHSLDGWFAPPSAGRAETAPVFLSGEAARQDVHRRRRRLDLVLVGEETVRADHPRLDGRLAADHVDVPDTDPMAGYVDTDLSWNGGFDRDHYVVFAGMSARRSANRAVIEADGGEILFCREAADRVDPVALCEAATLRDLLTIMVEGGPRLAASFLNAGMVDRWVRYLAPVVLGDGIGWPGDIQHPEGRTREFSLTRHEQVGDDLRVIHDRRNFADVLARVTV
ncbi:MAG: bifunctional diaminohydroxyphosphoribosylaminopyrimidine deaminase/5-amino-6-(5-phosphoribosylamino)uracil reductase RibD [Candidatus Krumholzibacteria bacterium]|nr:bifunctional diaminohydroxyphosphoribosylaminopyrimidine deaminase/5-amino-6-(5-phosphoribosylamino)uracil reductase RibD [Candidatus Krumholzibacteria bacterium]